MSEFIGRSLILPKGYPVISDMFAYKEGEIRFCRQKTRFESTDSLPWIPLRLGTQIEVIKRSMDERVARRV